MKRGLHPLNPGGLKPALRKPIEQVSRTANGTAAPVNDDPRAHRFRNHVGGTPTSEVWPLTR